LASIEGDHVRLDRACLEGLCEPQAFATLARGDCDVHGRGPNNARESSHALMHMVAAEGPWSSRLVRFAAVTPADQAKFGLSWSLKLTSEAGLAIHPELYIKIAIDARGQMSDTTRPTKRIEASKRE
jgi:hypothetical protein